MKIIIRANDDNTDGQADEYLYFAERYMRQRNPGAEIETENSGLGHYVEANPERGEAGADEYDVQQELSRAWDEFCRQVER